MDDLEKYFGLIIIIRDYDPVTSFSRHFVSGFIDSCNQKTAQLSKCNEKNILLKLLLI